MFSISLNGGVDVRTAGANAGITIEEQYGTRAEASASVVSAEGTIAINILGFEIEFGVNADVISAGVEAEAGIVKTKDGRTKIGYDAKTGAGWFGWGLVLRITLPF